MIKHIGTQTIKTERLLLRKFTTEDAEAMFTNWASDKQITKFLTWEPHSSIEATRNILEGWCAAYNNNSTYNWAITLNDIPIGSISIVRLSERSENAELGYCIGSKFWNKGYMTEAAKAVISFLFEQVGLNRVSISHAVKNPASGEVAKKCRMKFEGRKRKCFKATDGEFLDIDIYAILREEWYE